MRGLVAVILAIMTGMFCSVVTYLPEIGDANTAPNQHVTPTYISRSAEDTGSPNIVTGVIIDYRGFDTMWETSVMFLAGLTTVLVLTSNPVGRRPEEEPEVRRKERLSNERTIWRSYPKCGLQNAGAVHDYLRHLRSLPG